ncbi:MAG: hypothetical protein QXM31_01975 [Candidatus Woesearchaeota archaeon]
MKAAIAIAMVLLLAGCQYSPFQRKDAMTLPEVKVGTQGIELFLSPGSPPPEVYEESKFTMLVTLSNLGASDVENGVFSVSYEPQHVYLPLQQQQGRFSVRGKSEFMPQGMEKQVGLSFTAKPLGAQLQGYTTTITFNACYPYQTNAPIIVCIDTDLTGKKPGKVCQAKPISSPQGQGAPVAVTLTEPRMQPSEFQDKIIPEFVLTIKNLGKGSVIAPNQFPEACSGRPLGAGGWNVVAVSAALADMPLSCTPSTITLKETGDTKVVCKLEEGVDARLGTYTSPLSVTIDYGYMTSISSQVKITKIR